MGRAASSKRVAVLKLSSGPSTINTAVLPSGGTTVDGNRLQPGSRCYRTSSTCGAPLIVVVVIVT